MALTTSTVLPLQTSVSCGAQLYDIPTKDAACAVPAKINYNALMSHCCGPAAVTGYYNNCGLYCLAQGQTVGQLVDCLTADGVEYSDVFCNTNMSATATAAVTGGGKDGATSSGSGGGFSFTSATGRSSSSGGVVVRVDGVVSKVGLGIFALVVCAMGSGALM
jgi:hypothetical protein